MWYGRMSVRFSLNHTDDSAVESGDNQQRTNQGTLNAWQWCLLLAFCGHVHVTCIKGRMCLHINYTLHPIHFLFPPSRPKHPPKVHVWAGISQKGPTEISIFEGKMNAPLHTQILDKTLIPFLNKKFPTTHKFMRDNDPKHTSKHAKKFMDEKGINWWRTSPESPDLNPIENLWHELKEYIRREVMPTTKEQLIDGIVEFWQTVDTQNCKKYIGHLRKVIPKVIELNGEATGY